MVNGRLRFRLRNNFSQDSLNNARKPELSAFYKFLKQYNRRVFSGMVEFREDVLCGSIDYLWREKVPKGSDFRLRKGLYLDRSGNNGDAWIYTVYAFARNRANRFIFGGLEAVGK